MFQIWPLPLKTPLSLTLACQWALAASSLLSSSCFIPALLLAASLCPSPTLATLPKRHEDCALAQTTLNSLLKLERIMLLSLSVHSLPLARPLALSLESARISRRSWRSLLPSWTVPITDNYYLTERNTILLFYNFDFKTEVKTNVGKNMMFFYHL